MRFEDSEESGLDAGRYTVAEIRAALDGMSDDDHRRLTLVARYFAPRTNMSADDLRQEAFLRVLSSRTCKVGVGIVEFVAGTIQISRLKRRGPAEGLGRKLGLSSYTYLSTAPATSRSWKMRTRLPPGDRLWAELCIRKRTRGRGSRWPGTTSSNCWSKR